MAGRERGDSTIKDDGRQLSEGRDESTRRLGDEAWSGQRQEQREGQEKSVRSVTNSDGSVTNRYPDGSSARFDASAQPAKVLEIQANNGDVTSFKYKGKQLDSFSVTDGRGQVKEKTTKDGSAWKIERLNAQSGKFYHDKSFDITDVKVMQDGRIDLIDKQGLHHERQRNGNLLRRDNEGRVLAERTWSNRMTDYKYEGADKQPVSFDVKDSKGNIVEHGVRQGESWSVYKAKAGEAALDPKNLEDPGHLVTGLERVTSVQVDQRTGKRVEVHADGSRTWQALDDDRVFRRTPDGSMTVVAHTAEGKPQLLFSRSSNGLKITYEYDKKSGDLVGETREGADGQRTRLSRSAEGWVDQSGRVLNRKVEVNEAGSVVMSYPEKNLRLTQHANGSEMVESAGKDGKMRAIHTTDAHGKQTQFGYSDTGELNRLAVTYSNGEKVEWQKEPGKEVWVANRRDKQGNTPRFEGSTQLAADGSMIWTEQKTGKQMRMDMSGVTLDITRGAEARTAEAPPKPEVKSKK
jgi:hypothetical protein